MGNRRNDVVGLAISMPILAALAVAARILARRVMHNRLEADDFLIMAALVFCVALSVVILIAVYAGGLGSHLVFAADGMPADVTAFTTFSKMLWAMQFLSTAASGLTKLSVLFFYKRIFVGRTFTIIVWSLIGLCTAWTIGCTLAGLLDCIPVNLNWHPTVGSSGKCVNIVQMFWALQITDILTDVMILCVPWPQIIHLNMRTSQKWQVNAIFTLGFFVVGVGIARVVLFAPAVTGQDTDLDWTYTRVPPVNWTIVLVCIGVLSACLPTLRPLFIHHRLDRCVTPFKSLLGRFSRTPSTSSPHTVHERKAVRESPIAGPQGGNYDKEKHVVTASVEVEEGSANSDRNVLAIERPSPVQEDLWVRRDWELSYQNV